MENSPKAVLAVGTLHPIARAARERALSTAFKTPVVVVAKRIRTHHPSLLPAAIRRALEYLTARKQLHFIALEADLPLSAANALVGRMDGRLLLHAVPAMKDGKLLYYTNHGDVVDEPTDPDERIEHDEDAALPVDAACVAEGLTVHAEALPDGKDAPLPIPRPFRPAVAFSHYEVVDRLGLKSVQLLEHIAAG